jgi:broad specificity phosphatase PhoE
MSVFHLVRHAHAAWTPDENRPLSERGQRDAQRVAELLGERSISAVYASPARRARQTVAPLAERLGLPLRIEPALNERRLSATPVAASEFQAAVRATFADLRFAHPGGETNAAAQARGLDLVRVLVQRHPEAEIVLGTHGVLLALIVQGLLPAYGYPFWQALTMPDVYRLELAQAEGNPTCAPVLERLWDPRQAA